MARAHTTPSGPRSPASRDGRRRSDRARPHRGGRGGRPPGPPAARRRAPFGVFVNGVRQTEGEHYTVQGREITFARPIVKEGKVGGVRWLAMLLGLFGTYRKHEVVDVEYRFRGETKLAS